MFAEVVEPALATWRDGPWVDLAVTAFVALQLLLFSAGWLVGSR